jgi:hypothetical protein
MILMSVPREQAARLVRAHDQRDLLRFTQVINLPGKVQSPQRHPQQELQPGHDPIAVADAHAALGKVQLELTDVLGCGRIGGALEKPGKSLAAVNVAPSTVRTELARVHVLNHALAKRINGIRTHDNSCPG